MQLKKRLMLRINIVREIFILLIALSIISYIASRISVEYYNFIYHHFISLCRYMELPHEVWAFMDKYIFEGQL